jgi:hypothetical protein
VQLLTGAAAAPNWFISSTFSKLSRKEKPLSSRRPLPLTVDPNFGVFSAVFHRARKNIRIPKSNPNNRPKQNKKRFKITIFFDNLKQTKKITPNKTERTDFFWKRTPKMRDRRIRALRTIRRFIDEDLIGV